jgi:hypothetical protein
VLNERRYWAIAEMRRIAKAQGGEPKVPKPGDVAVEQRVAALVDGRDYSKAEAADADTSAAVRYWELSREIADIDAALPVLAIKLRDAQLRASALVRDRIRDYHRELVREMAAALRKVHEATTRYWALSDALNQAGASWSALGPAFPQFLGHPNDGESQFAYWFRQAVSDGHIAKSDVPWGL